jgi:hypothetical protein
MKTGGPFFCFMLLLATNSCNNEPSGIGSDFFQSGSLYIDSFDTLTLRVSTVALDSMITSNPARLLAGRHIDEELGIITAMPFFQITPGDVPTLTNASYSRATLLLRYDDYSYYDTLSSTTLVVHEVVEEIKLIEGSLYNTSSFDYDPEALGSITFEPRPTLGDSIEIPLSDDFGLNIYKLAEKSATEISSSQDFLKYLRGLAVSPGADANGAVLGFKTDAEVRIYYHDRSSLPVEERHFRLNTSSNIRFNHITADRSSTSLAPLSSQRSIRSVFTDHKAYYQGGCGLGIRVEIPYLRDILIDNPGLHILEAVLQFSPVPRSGKGNTPAPEVLAMYVVNGQNEVISISDSQVRVRLEEDVYLGRDTRYPLSILDFVNYQLAQPEFNQNAVLFTSEDEFLRSSVHRLYVGDQMSERPMKLMLYYVRVKD